MGATAKVAAPDASDPGVMRKTITSITAALAACAAAVTIAAAPIAAADTAPASGSEVVATGYHGFHGGSYGGGFHGYGGPHWYGGYGFYRPWWLWHW